MGSTRLAPQARFAAAQYERVLGRAVVATEKIGGRDVSRHSLWHTNDAQSAGLHGGGHAGVGVGNRREYLNFERGERLRHAPAARRKAGGISGSVLGQKDWHASLGGIFLCELRGFARAKQKLFQPQRLDGGFGRHQFQRKPQCGRQRARRGDLGRIGERQLLRRDGRKTDAGARLFAGRSPHAEYASGGGDKSFVVAAALQW